MVREDTYQGWEGLTPTQTSAKVKVMSFKFVYFLLCMITYALFLESCTNTKNDDFSVLISKAIEVEDKGQYKKAIEFIDDAIAIDSTQSFPFVMRGKIEGLLGNDLSAIEDFTLVSCQLKIVG